ncbi:hypothetical protein MVEN_01856100 [Mycena venus]|uniref:Uncharacterized protein n=1 Tax=Mycena venus TaxID=2733690 RepID=A0A8H6XHL4_9AGAR|nr:hypothetical protein MVEN_01856100 [Mycena venus]
MSIAGDDNLICFPNDYFTKDDVSRGPEGKLLIDISRDTPFPLLSPTTEREIFGDDSSDDAASDDGSYDAASDDGSYDAASDDIYIPTAVAPPELPHTIANVQRLILQIPLHDRLSVNFGSMLSGMGRDCAHVRPHNTYRCLEDGTFVLRHHFRLFFSQRLIYCAGLISTALNDHTVDARGFTPDAIPVTVPSQALQQLGIPFPTILVFLSRGWQLDERIFESKEEIEGHVEDFLTVLRFGMAVFGKIMIVARQLGGNSLCNPGAGIEMEKAEFLELAGSHDYRSQSIDAWLDQILLANAYIRRADDACARLFTIQTFSIFFTLEDNGKIALVPRVASGVVHDQPTHRVHTTAAEFGQQLARWGF